MYQFISFFKAATYTRLLHFLACCLAVLLLIATPPLASGCGNDDPVDMSRSGTTGIAASADQDARAVFVTAAGEHILELEVADTPAEKSQGLMGRTELAGNSGMVFVWQSPTRGGFWMKDTHIPLSIAFIDADGTIIDIQDMEPQTLDSHAPGQDYIYAIEVNQGYFDERGIRVSDTVELSGL